MKKFKFSIVGLICCFLVGWISCKKDSQATVNPTKEKIEIPFTKEGTLDFINKGEVIKTINIEIAETDNEQKQGLMHRSKMEINNGMLFIHDENDPPMQGYWMRNTRIPLDIMYIGADSVVINIAKNATPYQERGIPTPTAPKRFVVEINGGLSDKWGIIEGETKISWKKDSKAGTESINHEGPDSTNLNN